jgi:hypothetical protein
MIIKNNLKYLYLCSKLFKIIIENSQILNFGDIEVNYHGKNGNVYYIESKISRYAKTWKEMDFDKDLDPGFPTYLARATTGFYLEVLRHDLRGGDFFEGAFDQTQKYVCYLHNAAWWLTNGDLETSYALVNCDAHARKTGHQPLYENWIKTITPIPNKNKTINITPLSNNKNLKPQKKTT